MTRTDTLRITEIFHSLQGEANTVGIPTVFVRLTGCPLRCQYCDTAYAFEGGELLAIDDIVNRVENYDCDYVTVTGGEPLAQPNCKVLLDRLCETKKRVSLETSGAMDITGLHEDLVVVLDVKTPGSKECNRNRYENFSLLKPLDQVKFVICNREDYEWSRATLELYDLHCKVADVLFSPSWEEMPVADLAQWILEDRLPVRMQTQLHKIIWGSEPGR